jgi:hypothetical protein
VTVLPQFVDERLDDSRTGETEESTFGVDFSAAASLGIRFCTHQILSGRRVSHLQLDRTCESGMQGLRIASEL